MKSRRDALRTIAATAILPALNAQHQHTEPLVQIAKSTTPKHIEPDDFKLLGELVDVIIPRTDTPGATDAGVPFFIDRAIGKKPELGKTLHEGLAHFRETSFPPKDLNDPFFKLLKDLTIDGYYTSREGLTQELGYHGNTYLSEFKGCTHPEHQVGKNAN